MADIDFVHVVTYDERDVMCGRQSPLFGDRSDNLTARGSHLFYTVKRYSDPLIHVSGSSSSRTACGWSVIRRDEVLATEVRFPTCVRCLGIAQWVAARGGYIDEKH